MWFLRAPWLSRPSRPLSSAPQRPTAPPRSVQALLRRNRDQLLDQIEQATSRAGRESETVRLLPVTKSVTARVAMELFGIGQKDLAENRIDILESKRLEFEAAGLAPVWHFIGHIQRNKAARVVRAADVIHSVDSQRLLAALDRQATEAGRRLGIYLQVKLSGEEAKHGLSEAELAETTELARASESLELLGLMTMAPLAPDPDTARARALETFGRLAELGRTLPAEAFAGGRPELSMGMSGDFEEAIACGTDVVRIGSALFEGIDQAERVGPKFRSGEPG